MAINDNILKLNVVNGITSTILEKKLIKLIKPLNLLKIDEIKIPSKAPTDSWENRVKDKN